MWMNSFKLNEIITSFSPAMSRQLQRWVSHLFVFVLLPVCFCPVWCLNFLLQRFLDVVQTEQSKKTSFIVWDTHHLVLFRIYLCSDSTVEIYRRICSVLVFIHNTAQLSFVSSSLMIVCVSIYLFVCRNSSGLWTLLSCSTYLCGTRGGSWQTGFH